MKGTPHDVWAVQEPWHNQPRGVGLANVEDDYYWCVFETPDEVNALVTKLLEARDALWPSEPIRRRDVG